ncbi:MAG: transglutaminase domain-containing protein [Bacteroidales bacterium]|jgi:hypothetical protein|nr:transglutaminase domain-containing protein [Bacteroidales bacterium]
MRKILLIFLSVLILTACQSELDAQLEFALESAGGNRAELEHVIAHYDSIGDKEKTYAAKWLIANMHNKYCYSGKIIERYAPFFEFLDSMRRAGIKEDSDKRLSNTWDSLVKQFGTINITSLSKDFDTKKISSSFLIQNIDEAFIARRTTPTYCDTSFNTFLEYILPYRIDFEKPEVYRAKYKNLYGILRDTTTTVEGFKNVFMKEFVNNQGFDTSKILYNYPLELTVSQMELARRGTCRHKSIYTVQVMRALGVPCTIDYVPHWGNTSNGHVWNAIMLQNGKSFPFNAMTPNDFEIKYKPAKIFRKRFSNNYQCIITEDIPSNLWSIDFEDVSDEYKPTFDITIKCKDEYRNTTKKYGVICVADRKEWIPVWFGEFNGKSFKFNKMIGDVVYIAAFYDGGKIIPASNPFLLKKDGQIHYFEASDATNSVTVRRKYPYSKHQEMRAKPLIGSSVEASNDKYFHTKETLLKVERAPINYCDTIVSSSKKYRYIRWFIGKGSCGDLAEVIFYGKKSPNNTEQILLGQKFGFPSPDENRGHSYFDAMDGNEGSYFSKPRSICGYVGIDLGKGNEMYITRVEYYPRSDTNYLLKGDEYELCYWNGMQWISVGSKKAITHELTFESVPKGTLYHLRDLTKGTEERIFTYEDGKQVFY